MEHRYPVGALIRYRQIDNELLEIVDHRKNGRYRIRNSKLQTTFIIDNEHEQYFIPANPIEAAKIKLYRETKKEP